MIYSKRDKQILYWLGIGTGITDLFPLNSFDSILGFDARDCVFLGHANESNIIFKKAIISDEEKNVTFKQYNVSEYSAISEPARLSEIFPNFTCNYSFSDLSHDVSKLIGGVDDSYRNILLVDIIDLNFRLIKRLIDVDKIKDFDSVYILSAKVSLYEVWILDESLIELLEENGFRCRGCFFKDSLSEYILFSREYLYDKLSNLESEVVDERLKVSKLVDRLKRNKVNSLTRIRRQNSIIRDNYLERDLLVQEHEKSKDLLTSSFNSITTKLKDFVLEESVKNDDVGKKFSEVGLLINLFGSDFLNNISDNEKKLVYDFLDFVLEEEKLDLEQFFAKGKNNILKNKISDIELLFYKLKCSLSNFQFHDEFDKKIAHESLGLIDNISSLIRSKDIDQGKDCKVTKVDELILGNAWAANTVNTVVFRHEALVSVNGYQFGAYYASETSIKLFRRQTGSNKLDTFEIEGSFNIRDAHNSISLGVDLNNYLHISYDHHGSVLRYRRSLNPLEISAWSGERALTDKDAKKVTYPCFVRSTVPGNSYFMMLYRNGSASRGEIILNTFDHDKEIWERLESPVLSGISGIDSSANAYLNTPIVDRKGNLALSFVWRTQSSNDEQLVNNLNVGFASSDNKGMCWKTSSGRPLSLPITPFNCETICAVGPESNLMNQCAMTYDNYNRPHIIFYANDLDGIVQYKHLWFDGREWICDIISSRNQPFALTGKGTLRLPISRPAAICDKANNVHVIYRGDKTDDKLVLLTLKPPFYLYDDDNLVTLDNESLGNYEPIIDRSRWEQEEVLSIYFQSTEQIDNEGVSKDMLSSLARIIDFKIGQ